MEARLGNIESVVREFLARELGKDVTGLTAEDSLLESGTVDSVAVMRLVAFLETRFGIAIGEDDLLPENFDTMSAISAFVARRQAAARG